MKKISTKSLFLNFLFLNIFGLAMIYSTTFKNLISYQQNGFKALIQQSVFVVLVLALWLLAIWLNRKVKLRDIINKFIDPLFIFTLIALVLVLTPVGNVAGGARSVIRLPGFDFQPVELYKIALIFYFAKWASNRKNPTTFEYIIYGMALPGIGIILTAIEPDAGGMVFLGTLLLFLLILYGQHLKVLFGIFFTALVGFIGIIFFSSDSKYQSDRIMAWLNPFDYVDGTGNNLLQSYVSISNGGVTGLGYTNSIQKTGYLFGSNTDFIFSIISEELGIAGAVFTIGLLVTLAYQVYIVGKRTNRVFEYFYCSGFAFIILIQSFINIAGVTGVIPMTGITLPFISQGTNSYLFLSFGFIYVYLIEMDTIRQRKREEKLKFMEDNR